MEYAFLTVPILLFFAIVTMSVRAFVIHRRLSRLDEQRYRQYVADMEAVNRRFRANTGRADSGDSPLFEEKF